MVRLQRCSMEELLIGWTTKRRMHATGGVFVVSVNFKQLFLGQLRLPIERVACFDAR